MPSDISGLSEDRSSLLGALETMSHKRLNKKESNEEERTDTSILARKDLGATSTLGYYRVFI